MTQATKNQHVSQVTPKLRVADRFACISDPGRLYKPGTRTFRGVVYVDGVGLFLTETSAYGLRDLQMEALQAQYPDNRIVFLGGAEEFDFSNKLAIQHQNKKAVR